MNSSDNFIVKFRYEILIALIVAVVMYIAQSFGTILYYTLPQMKDGLAAYTNSVVITKASECTSFNISASVYSILTSLMLGALSGFLVYSFFTTIQLKKKIKSHSKKIDKITSVDSSDILRTSESDVQKELNSPNISEYVSMTKKLTTVANSLANGVIAIITLMIVLTIILILNTSLYIKSIKMYSEYEHELSIIECFSSSYDIKNIEYHWLNMRDEDDLMLVWELIEEQRDIYGLENPK